MAGEDLVPLDEWHVTLYAEAELADDEASELRSRAAALVDDGVRQASATLGAFGRVRFGIS